MCGGKLLTVLKCRRAGGAPAAFDPSQITSASILLGHEARAADLYTDAGTTPVASDGDAVYQWDEAYGPSGSFSQTTQSLRPQWKPDYFASGKHAVLFDGTDDYMQRATAAQAQAFEVWVAGKMVTAASRRFVAGRTDATPVIQGNAGSVWAAYAGTFITGGTRDTNNHVWRFLANGVSSDLRVDGSSVVADDAGALAVEDGLTIGASNSGTLPANFAFAAVYLFDDALSSGDAASMLTYMQGLLS